MSKIKLILLISMVLGFVVSGANLYASSDSGGQLPIVCVPRDSAEISVSEVWANPDQQDVEIPITFSTAGDDDLSGFEFNVTIPNGLIYDDFIGGSWDTLNLYIDTLSGVIEVQGWDDVLSGGAEDTLLTLLFDIADTVDFNVTMDLDFTDDVYFNFSNSGDTAFDPTEIDGWVKTGDDSIYVDVGEVNGNSYQAYDSTCSEKSEMYVEVPIELYTCFRAGDYEFTVKHFPFPLPDPLPYEYVGYDTTNALFGADAVEITDYLFRIRCLSGTDIPAGTDTTLITMWFKITDFAEQYNNDLEYDTSFAIEANTAGMRYVECYNSDERVSLIPGTNFQDGSIVLPDYDVTFAGTACYADTVQDTVSVPIRCNSSYYGQFYTNLWKFDYTKLDFIGIDPGDEPVPQSLDADVVDTIGNWVFLEVMTHNVEDDEYIISGDRVIYNLRFNTLTQTGFTYLHPGSELSYTGILQDYFSSYNNGKIFRSSFDSTAFTMSSCTIFLSGTAPVMAPLEPHQAEQESSELVSIDDDEAIPFTYNLDQNYPNPFNATTNICFSIAEQGHVQIDIYDILGQKVKTMVEENLLPGQHQVRWNGTNGYGSQVSSGFYFYILQANDFKQSRKMLLLK